MKNCKKRKEKVKAHTRETMGPRARAFVRAACRAICWCDGEFAALYFWRRRKQRSDGAAVAAASDNRQKSVCMDGGNCMCVVKMKRKGARNMACHPVQSRRPLVVGGKQLPLLAPPLAEGGGGDNGDGQQLEAVYSACHARIGAHRRRRRSDDGCAAK